MARSAPLPPLPRQATVELNDGKARNTLARAAYAFEELIAEIGNAILCSHLGLTPDFEQSGAYVESWLKALNDDKRAIFRAAAEAQKAVDLLTRTAEASAMATA